MSVLVIGRFGFGRGTDVAFSVKGYLDWLGVVRLARLVAEFGFGTRDLTGRVAEFGAIRFWVVAVLEGRALPDAGLPVAVGLEITVVERLARLPVFGRSDSSAINAGATDAEPAGGCPVDEADVFDFCAGLLDL